MQIAIVLFDRFTALDAVGPYETLGRLPDAELVFVAERTGPVRADTGNLAITADRALADVSSPDIVVVPGGPGQTPQMENETLLDWLRAADATSTWTTSVCTGSLLLAAAGLLQGRRATSHWLALDFLEQFGAEPTGSGSSSTASTSPRPASPPASTWDSPCSAGSPATNTPRPYSC